MAQKIKVKRTKPNKRKDGDSEKTKRKNRLDMKASRVVFWIFQFLMDVLGFCEIRCLS